MRHIAPYCLRTCTAKNIPRCKENLGRTVQHSAQLGWNTGTRYSMGRVQDASRSLVSRGCHAHNHVVGRPVVAHAAKYSTRPMADLTVVQRRPFVPLMAARPLRGTAFHIKRTSVARPARFFSCRRLGKRLICCSWVRYSNCAHCS